MPFGCSRDEAKVALAVPAFWSTDAGGGKKGFRASVTDCSAIVVLKGFWVIIRPLGLPATVVESSLLSMPSITGRLTVSKRLLIVTTSFQDNSFGDREGRHSVLAA